MTKTKSTLRIAIDGPAGAGKTVVGNLIAEKLGYRFFDTGLVYRALALAAIDNDVVCSDEKRLHELAGRIKLGTQDGRPDSAPTYRAVFDNEDINARLQEPSVSEMASKVSIFGSVRKSLLGLQRGVIETGRVVAAGRDVGTVVAPDADLKFFLMASPEKRAARRFHEILNRGENADYRTVLAELRKRDQRDTIRLLSPTVPAGDAIILRTDDLTVQEVVHLALNNIKRQVD